MLRALCPSLPARGRFLEIGAFDGVTDSVTREFREAGWAGLMVEANPVQFAKLLALNLPASIQLLSAAIVPDDGPADPLPFWIAGGQPRQMQMSTASESWRLKPWCLGAKWRRIDVARVPVSRLLAAYGRDFDAVCIDAEGLSIPLFNAFPWAEMPAVKAICVEAARQDIAFPAGFHCPDCPAPNVVLERTPCA